METLFKKNSLSSTTGQRPEVEGPDFAAHAALLTIMTNVLTGANGGVTGL